MARKINGKITVEGGSPPDTQLRVMAWDADIDEDDHIGMTLVAEDGSYSIEYEDEKWDWCARGSTLTDDNGEYRIHYAANQWYQAQFRNIMTGIGFARARWCLDLFIKVLKKSGSGVLYRCAPPLERWLVC